MTYVPLQVKTSYSMLNSLNAIPKLIAKCLELGIKEIAITDSNNMFGVMEFYKECKKNNIKPIIGIELDILNSKILLYAKNYEGYQNLIKLSTIVSDRKLEIEDLTNHSNNLILVMPYSYYNKEIYNLYKEKYIGYSNIEEKEKIKEKKVYINNVSYLEKNEYIYLNYAYLIKEGKVLGDSPLDKYKDNYLKTHDEVLEVSDEEDILNTKEIANLCNVEIGYNDSLLPIYDENIDVFSYLTTLCNKGLKRRLKDNVSDVYQKRLDYELDVINKMGFCNYFLVVYDYVKYAKQNNILVGPGRGSAAGSLVSYTLGITDIDPIEYNLVFERFLNKERITMPDIDIDFDGEKRSQVIDYVVNKYGEKKVAGIITFNTLGAKQVIRDVSRVMEIKLGIVDEITKHIKFNETLTDALKNNYLKRMITSSNELKKMYDIALHLEGLPRHVSIHAAGIIMSRLSLDETIPLYRSDLGIYLTGYSMEHLEELGLLKMDFLGLKNLTLIDELINNIREKEKLNITFNNIPTNDKKALKVFHDVDTNGVFQFESTGMKQFLKEFRPTTKEDVIAAIALFRPGPMQNIPLYIKRKTGKEKIDYFHDNLKEILEPTYGVIIYQEQVMQIANILAGYTLAEADLLRRAMSKKKEDILLKEKEKFIKKSILNGYEEDLATKIYDLILKFAGYGFNRAHSVSYAIIAIKMAFLKVYFQKYFYTSLLNNVIGSEEKTKTYIFEVRSKNINILLPDINKSLAIYTSEERGIRVPLSIIKSVGNASTIEIINERNNNGPYLDFIDFVKRTSGKLSSKVITALIDAGVFSSFGETKNTLISNLDEVINYAKLAKNAGLIEVEKPLLIKDLEYDKQTLIEKELKVFGFYLSVHPVSKYKKESDIDTNRIKNYLDKRVNLTLYIEKIKETITKKNDVMAFLNCSDEFGNVIVVCFPDVYKKYNNIEKSNIIKIYGKVEKRYDEYQVIANNIEIVKEE